MSRPLSPLLSLLANEFPGEPGRHQGEPPGRELWEAHADRFASRLLTKLVETAAAEIEAGLGDGSPLCLHKAAAALNAAATDLLLASDFFTQALTDLQERFMVDEEGGEG